MLGLFSHAVEYSCNILTDLDECAEDGYCDQNCRNYDGGYSCSCFDGYTQSTNDPHRCVAINGMFLLSVFKYITCYEI